MKVHHVMSATVITVAPNASFKHLWEHIFRSQIHALPVVDAQKKLIGIVSEEDLVKPLYPDYKHFIEDLMTSEDFEDMEEKIEDLADLKAKDVMSTRVIFTRSDTPIMRALSRMMVRNVRQLPVVDDAEMLIGMVSKGDIFEGLMKKRMSSSSHKSSSKKKK